MKRKKADFRTHVNDNLEIDFAAERLTSCSLQGLLIWYLHKTGWSGLRLAV